MLRVGVEVGFRLDMVRLTAVGDSTPAWTSLTVSVPRAMQSAVAVRLHSMAAKVMYCTSLAGRACCSVSRWTSWCRLWCARCGAAGLNSAHEAEAVGSYKLT